ncbi:MAG TPA: HAD-IA family hydrolase [Fimbriimonadaceae bacterium]|nr:HAD-IA family hydrolase [Fimbriimonadaceae bacterium]HRJ32960.1 HAD-IA family hydrolase [Fimbriimonadaceae bacterium]
MNSPVVITFDCAHTLMDAQWDPARLAVQCAEELGHPLDRSRAHEVYRALLAPRWGDYQRINLSRDPRQTDAFWRELTQDWLHRVQIPDTALDPILDRADELLFGANSTTFALYDDVLPTLTELARRGQRMAVISNWDVTLHKALAMHGLTPFFERVIASLEWGIEKPDPRLFELTLDQLGVSPQNVLHIGDNPVDDVQGARSAGLQAWLLDRSSSSPGPTTLTSLTQLLDRL